MSHATSEASAGDQGYPIGRRVLDLLANEDDDSGADLWNLVRREFAEVFKENVLRVAHSLPQELLAVVLSVRVRLDLALPQDQNIICCSEGAPHPRHRGKPA